MEDPTLFRLTLLLIGLTFLAPCADAELDKRRLDRLDAALEQYVADGELAGAVVRVAHRGKVVKLSAYGLADREAGVPMQTNTIFRIASQTKAVVSVAVMMLQERGELLIDHPLHRYLPEWESTTVAVAAENDAGYEVVPANRAITIRDLLTHTAGVDYGWAAGKAEWETAGITGWYFGHREEPIRETVRRMAALPQAAQPGEAWVYGYATDILGALVEVVSGQLLDEFLQANIFEPLDMNDTHFYLPANKADRLAVVYSHNDNGPIRRAPDVSAMVGQGAYVEGPRKSFSGGAGLLSTARDYGRFLDALQLGGRLGRARILSRKTVELMTVDHLGDIEWQAGNGFGLGFLVAEDLGASGQPGSVGRFGWGGAYHTVYWVDPAEELTVTYMTQLLPAAVDDHGKLRALIYQAIN